MRTHGGVVKGVLLAAMLSTASAAMAQAHVRADEAMAALKRNDCAATVAALRQGMADNEPDSFYLSGSLAETGTCAQADSVAAAKAYERAAFLGNRNAAEPLALLYAEGDGVQQSYPLAGRWYAIAALGGSPSAVPDAAPYEKPEAIARTYTRAVHDLASFELANRLKYPYPLGVRVRFDPRTGVATVVGRTPGAGPREVADRDILASYAEAIRDLPKPAIPATGDFATERAVGRPDGAN